MITKRYHVECDGCHAIEPEGAFAKDTAIYTAEMHNWKCYIGNTSRKRIHLCPTCAAKQLPARKQDINRQPKIYKPGDLIV